MTSDSLQFDGSTQWGELSFARGMQTFQNHISGSSWIGTWCPAQGQPQVQSRPRQLRPFWWGDRQEWPQFWQTRRPGTDRRHSTDWQNCWQGESFWTNFLLSTWWILLSRARPECSSSHECSESGTLGLCGCSRATSIWVRSSSSFPSAL